MRYAIIEHNKVANVAIAEYALASNWIQHDTAAIGDDFINGEVVKASVPAVVTPVLPWTKKEFLLKFTPAEYAGIIAATKVNALLDYYWQLFMVTENVLKTDPATIAGIQALEVNGLLAEGRAAEILA